MLKDTSSHRLHQLKHHAAQLQILVSGIRAGICALVGSKIGELKMEVSFFTKDLTVSMFVVLCV